MSGVGASGGISPHREALNAKYFQSYEVLPLVLVPFCGFPKNRGPCGEWWIWENSVRGKRSGENLDQKKQESCNLLSPQEKSAL